MATTELLKKVLYTGVGVVSTTTDRVKKSMEDLTQVSEDAKEEGKKKVETFSEDLSTRREDLSARFKKVIDTVLGQFDLPNRTDAEGLNAKIAELEEKIVAKKKIANKVTKEAIATVEAAVAEVKEVVKK